MLLLVRERAPASDARCSSKVGSELCSACRACVAPVVFCLLCDAHVDPKAVFRLGWYAAEYKEREKRKEKHERERLVSDRRVKINILKPTCCEYKQDPL